MEKKYRLRDGVVLTTVCGETLLVATREARGKCPNTLHLDDGAVFMFSLLENTLSENKMIAEISAHFHVTEKCAKTNIDAFIKQLTDCGCIVAEDC